MKEMAEGVLAGYETQDNCQDLFQIVHNYRQQISKKRRKVLRKAHDERKRMARASEESESEVAMRSEHRIDNYYEDEPWDILMEDSARFKACNSSTNSFQQNQADADEQKRQKQSSFSTTFHDSLPKFELFLNIFTPFAFESF